MASGGNDWERQLVDAISVRLRPSYVGTSNDDDPDFAILRLLRLLATLHKHEHVTLTQRVVHESQEALDSTLCNCRLAAEATQLLQALRFSPSAFQTPSEQPVCASQEAPLPDLLS